MRLRDQVALITGGAQGIGRRTALRLAADGASVAILDRDEAAGRATTEEILSAGGRAAFAPCDVADEASASGAFQDVDSRFGGFRILVTAAGILQGAYQPVDALDPECFDRVIDVNLRGTFLACRHAVPRIERSGGGVVLCVGSGAGVRGPSSSIAYGASKAGVHGLCMTLEPQLAQRGVRIHAVCPGSIDTALKRQNVRDGAAARGEDPEGALARARLGDPDGVARVLAFLASDDAAYVTGPVFTR